MPPYWGPIRNRWLLRVGDVTSDDALNRRLSPVFHAGSMRAPLLMGQGGNDVRVTQVGVDRAHAVCLQRLPDAPAACHTACCAVLCCHLGCRPRRPPCSRR